MVTTDLGACEWFVWDLRRSNLIDRGQLDQLVGEFLEHHPNAEPPALAEYLISRDILTQFQANRILEGKTQGFVLGPYTLMDALGTGSMGTVYKAQSKNDNQWYAIKVLPRRSMWNVRIARRKVRSFEQCKHPAVVPFLDVGTAGGMHYLCWPLVEGETLDKLVVRDGKLAPERAASYALQVAEGLDSCHRQGLFHGLLKPSNLMVETNHQLHILDCGIGALLAETEGESLVDTMSTANSVASGLDCASPESIMDPQNLTPIGDQYSLGCTLYFMLSGSYPFPEGSAAEKMMCHQLKQPAPLATLVPGLPEELVALVERLMQKDPGARYASTAEVIESLKAFAGDLSAHAPLENKREVSRNHAPAKAVATAAAKAVVAAPHVDNRLARPQSEPPLTPRPSAPSPIPTRQSMRNGTGSEETPTVSHTPVRPPPVEKKRTEPRPPAAPAKSAAPEPRVARRDYKEEMPTRSWEERLGPVGIALGAIIMCVLAWLLTWKLF